VKPLSLSWPRIIKNVNINKSLSFPWVAGSKPRDDEFVFCKGLLGDRKSSSGVHPPSRTCLQVLRLPEANAKVRWPKERLGEGTPNARKRNDLDRGQARL
jgi:hypothetical protein